MLILNFEVIRPLWKLVSLRNFLVLSKISRITLETLVVARTREFERNFTKTGELQ
jgi:hypothetical protein